MYPKTRKFINNMGIGFELIVDKEIGEELLSIPESYNLDAKIIGHCKQTNDGNRVTIYTDLAPNGAFNFEE